MNPSVEEIARLVYDVGNLGHHETGLSGNNQAFFSGIFVFPTKSKLDSNHDERSSSIDRVISIDRLHYKQDASVCYRHVHSFSANCCSC